MPGTATCQWVGRHTRTGNTSWASMARDKMVTYQAQAPVVSDTCVNTDSASLILLTTDRADVGAKRPSGALMIEGNIEKG
jgi:hypothetical protein